MIILIVGTPAVQLGILWKNGGCTPQNGLGGSGQMISTSYDVALYPSCGQNMLEERQRRLPGGTTVCSHPSQRLRSS